MAWGARHNLSIAHQDRDLATELTDELRVRRDVDLFQPHTVAFVRPMDERLHVVAQVTAGSSEQRQANHAEEISAQIASAAARGESAAMIGRPTTR